MKIIEVRHEDSKNINTWSCPGRIWDCSFRLISFWYHLHNIDKVFARSISVMCESSLRLERPDERLHVLFYAFILFFSFNFLRISFCFVLFPVHFPLSDVMHFVLGIYCFVLFPLFDNLLFHLNSSFLFIRMAFCLI